MMLNEPKVELPPDSIPTARWLLESDDLFLLYGNAHAKLNGWDVTGDPRRTKYLFLMQESIAKALASGALKTKDRITGAYQDLTDEARERGNVDLQDFCDWARQAGITGAPLHARDLAAALGLQLEVDKARAPLGAKSFKPAQGLPKPLSETSIKPVQRCAAQDSAVLAKLCELGFDAQAVPLPARGKRSEAKHAVRKALGYSEDVMKKAWQRLRNDGSIKDALP